MNKPADQSQFQPPQSETSQPASQADASQTAASPASADDWELAKASGNSEQSLPHERQPASQSTPRTAAQSASAPSNPGKAAQGQSGESRVPRREAAGNPPAGAPTARPNTQGSKPAQTTTPQQTPPEPPYWSRKRIGITAVAALVLIGGAVWAFSGSSKTPKITYLVTPVTRGTVTLSVSAKGVLAVVDQTDVRAATDGTVATVLVNSGDHVSSGQLLARLTDGDARQDLARAQDDIAYNQANLKQSQASEAQSAAAAKRADFLKQHNAAPLGAYEESQADLNRAGADVARARAQVQMAQGRVQQANVEIAARDVHAPIDGIVLKRNVQVGDAAREHGEPLFTLAGDVSQLKLDAAFPESQLGALRVGQPVEFIVPAYPSRAFAGTLSTLDLLPADNHTDSGDPLIPSERVAYKGVVSVANIDGMLRPGMTATITVITAQAKDVMVVPNTALSFVPPPKPGAKPVPALAPVKAMPGDAKHGRVWTHETNGLRPHDVVLGLSDGRQTQILQGDLKLGDKLVTGSTMAADTDKD